MLISNPLMLCGAAALDLAQLPDSGAPQLRICSQNLHRLGEPAAKEKKNRRSGAQKRYLARRIIEAQCDVVALQEIYGEHENQARAAVSKLQRVLEKRMGKKFVLLLGATRDPKIRNGFLVSTNAGSVTDVRSFIDEPLPKLQPLGPPSYFMRACLGFVLRLDRRAARPPNDIAFITMHFKSKADSYKDPSGTDFELLRMEMAAALYRIAQQYRRKLPKQTPVVVLGDRNNDEQSASADILSGERRLEDFSRPARCRLDAKHRPACSSQASAPSFVGLLELCRSRGGTACRGGSYLYRGKQQLLDEILVHPDDLDRFQDATGGISAGFSGRFFRGSDHRLLWGAMRLGPLPRHVPDSAVN